MPDRPPWDVVTAFGATVRAQRQARGWSQEQFADRVGLHRTYIGDIERGERNVSLINVERISRGLDLSLAALMSEVERDR
jgi:transcriptional regulator with XRE-family HTH domain